MLSYAIIVVRSNLARHVAIQRIRWAKARTSPNDIVGQAMLDSMLQSVREGR